jgi:hypothetical protein
MVSDADLQKQYGVNASGAYLIVDGSQTSRYEGEQEKLRPRSASPVRRRMVEADSNHNHSISFRNSSQTTSGLTRPFVERTAGNSAILRALFGFFS